MKQIQYSRWHRYDTNNIKYITQCDVDKHPEPLSQEGYTDWKRGTGPHSPEAYLNVSAGIRRACLGVAKTEATKQKMREASRGKPKSEAHKEAMRLSHKLRRGIKNEQQHNNSIQIPR
jgi:hypothetical protein